MSNSNIPPPPKVTFPKPTFSSPAPNISLQVEERSVDETDFLSDLNSDKFVSKSVILLNEKQQIKYNKEQDALQKKGDKEQARRDKQQASAEKQAVKRETDLFDEQGTELFGRDRLQLIAKINQYKILFPSNDALKKLKIKKKASVEELQDYLAECSALVECETVDVFITDAILQTIKLSEYATCRTKFNLTGLTAMLKENIQFNSLCKQLYLKYKVFSSIPPEYQLGIIVATSAWICVE